MDIPEFKKIIFPSKDKLYRLAKMMLRNTEEAEDILQEVLLRLWNERKKLNSYNSIEAFAMKMTKNLCLDRLKSKRYKNHFEISNFDFQSGTADPYQQASSADSAAIMKKLFNELPEVQKLIIHLRDVEEYSFEEIQELTGLNINNIRVNLSRARNFVRTGYLKIINYENPAN